MKDKKRSRVSVVNGAKVEHHSLEEELASLRSVAPPTGCRVCKLPKVIQDALATAQREHLSPFKVRKWLEDRHHIVVGRGCLGHHLAHHVTPKEA